MAENLHKSFVTLFRDLQLKRPLITFLVDGRCMLWLSAVAHWKIGHLASDRLASPALGLSG